MDEKLSYQRRIWTKRQRKNRDPRVKMKRKLYQRKNRAKLKMRAKQRYKKYRVNPTYKRQRKIQRTQSQKRRRMAFKVAMAYVSKISAKEMNVSIKDLPKAIQALLRNLGIRPVDVEVKASQTYSPSMAGAYGEGYMGFGYVIDLGSGKTVSWTSPWGLPIADRSTHPIPVNGAVLIGQQGGSAGGKRVSYILINPNNFDTILNPVEIELSIPEKKALYIIGTLKSSYRREEFSRASLGEYSPQNQYVKSLQQKGLVKVTGTGVSITTEGKNMKKGMNSGILVID